MSNVNLAGNIPTPTVPPASIALPQSPGAFTLGTGVPPGGAPELLLVSAPLHPALTNSPHSAATPNTVRATRSMFMVRFSLKIITNQYLFRLALVIGRLNASFQVLRFHPAAVKGSG